MIYQVFGRNLTARAAAKVAGNPVTTRLESGVGNCFPGLEFDHRNLDRRFFPRLVFNFGVAPPALLAVDESDPALGDTTKQDSAALSDTVARAIDTLRRGSWQLSAITQGGRTLHLESMAADRPDPALFWRIVRSLTPGKVTIVLTHVSQRTRSSARARPRPRKITLTHYRRRFVDSDSGAIPAAYLPGELTQSLCSPWMHDFRDCACDYWASNHPDIALGTDDTLAATGPAAGNADLATRPLDWLRADRQGQVAADAATEVNDALRLRHYQINSEWKSLAFVLEGRENTGVYAPGLESSVAPFAAGEELAKELVYLCGLEHVVMLEYLYAYYSLRTPESLKGQLSADLLFVRHELLGVAVGEMRHLRWANQLLWTLAKLGVKTPPLPALAAGLKVPTATGTRPRVLRPLTLEALADFVAVERPSGSLDGAYARVVATLRNGYPEPILQLARQIVADGVDHYNRFREIKVVLDSWAGKGDPTPCLRPLKPDAAKAAGALTLYRAILNNLDIAYRHGDLEDAGAILKGRGKMMELNAEAERLAARGVGIPFF